MTRDDPRIVAAKAGDPEAWRELYRAHAGRLLLWLSRRPCDDPVEGAEDLASHAWLTAADRIAEFHGDTDRFAGWLFGIARHLQANAHRKAQRRQTVPADLSTESTSPGAAAGAAPTVPDHAVELALDAWLHQGLERLSPRERDVISCTEILGLDVQATTEALGMKAPAVRVARMRGLRRLRAAWSESDD